MSCAHLAAAAAVVALLAAAAPGLPWIGDAHAATHGGAGAPAAAPDVIAAQWSIVEAVVAAGIDPEGRDGLVVITGTADRQGGPIMAVSRAPDGAVLDRVSAGAAAASDGSFLAEVPTSGPGWTANGMYAIAVYQDAAAGGEDGPPPYADIVPVAMSGGLALPNAEFAGEEVPRAAAGYVEPYVVNLVWSLVREVSVAPGGGEAGGDVIVLSGRAPAGADSVPVRVVSPTGFELAAFEAGADGPSGRFEATLVTDGSRWSQDGTYRITVGGGGGGQDAPPPDLFFADIFDGSLVPAASASAAAADPRGEGASGTGAAGAAQIPLAKRWEIVDAVAVSGSGGPGQRILIAGSSDRPDVPVSVRVGDPQGRAAYGTALMPDGPAGGFIFDIPAAGAAWSADGAYIAVVEQRDALTGAVHYSDLLELASVDGGIAAQPRLAGAELPASISDAYADARPVALEYVVVDEVRAAAGAGAAADRRGPYTEIVIEGRTSDRSSPLSVAAVSPGGSAAPPMRIEPGADGRFDARISTAGPFWSADGAYTVTVTQNGDASPFADVAVVRVQDGAVLPAPPAPAGAAAAPSAADATAQSGLAPRVMNIGERWEIIDSVVLAEDADGAGQVLVVLGTAGIADRAVQASVSAPDGSDAGAAYEAVPDASGAVVLEVPAGRSAWGPGAPDGTYTLVVGQPGTRYLDEYPVRILGGRIAPPAEFADAPLPAFPSGDRYGSTRLLDMTWSLVERADVVASSGVPTPTVVIRGATEHPKVPVAVRAESPGGAVLYDERIAPNADGSFAVGIATSGGGWAGDGTYRITVQQEFESVPPDLVLVEVVDGAVVPEFGAVALLVLAAAVAAAAVAAPRLGLAGARPAAAA